MRAYNYVKQKLQSLHYCFQEGATMNDSIDKIAVDAITIIQHLGQYELAEILMNRYEKVIK